MKKRGLLLFLLLFSILLVRASDVVLNLNLDKTEFSVDEPFLGTFKINYTGQISGDELLVFDVEHCEGFNPTSITFYELANNSNIGGFSEGSYTAIGNPYNSYTKSLTGAGSFLVGFKLSRDYYEGYLSSATMSLGGRGEGLRLDIGDDGVQDWEYSGVFENFSSSQYPEGVVGDESYDDAFTITSSYGACQIFEIEPEKKYAPLKLRVNAKIRFDGSSQGSYLNATIGGYSCNMGTFSSETYQSKACDIEIEDPFYEDGKLVIDLCLNSNGGYQVPRKRIASSNYYFMNVQPAVYDSDFSGEVIISGTTLTGSLTDYMDPINCNYENDYCTIPIRVALDSGGQITIDDVLIKSGSFEYTSIREVKRAAPILNLSRPLTFDLEAVDGLNTPDEYGNDCVLKLSFGGSVIKANFSVVKLPIAVLNVDKQNVAVKELINFDAIESYSPENNTITSFRWNFGDNKTGLGKEVTHFYDREGNYSVSLIVVDNESRESSPVKIVIYVGSLEEFLPRMLSDTADLIKNAKKNYDSASANVKSIYTLFGYDSIFFSTANSTLNGLKANFTRVQNSSSIQTLKEVRYGDIADALLDLQKNVPKNIVLLDFLEFQNMKLTNLDQIIDCDLSSAYDSNKRQAVYGFNVNNVDVDMEASLIEVRYLVGNKKGLLIDKDISVTGGSNNVLAENLIGLTNNISEVEVFSTGFSTDSWQSVLYFDAYGTRDVTYFVPGVIEVQEVDSIVFTDVEGFSVEPYNGDCDVANNCCGDDVCQVIYEDEDSCPEDCTKQKPWVWWIVLFVVLVAGVWYINFYKGPGNFREVTNKVTMKLFHKRMFVTPQDKINLSAYIKRALGQGFRNEQIRKVLLQKGWTNNQIDYIFKERFK
ncbi:MAG: PKD domain-containing protein [Nanoarchaeota archaeon]